MLNARHKRNLILAVMAALLCWCVPGLPAHAEDRIQAWLDSGAAGMAVEAKEALTLLSKERQSEAVSVLKKRLGDARKKGEVDVPALYLLALVDYSNYRTSSALGYLKQIERYYSKSKQISANEQMLLQERMAQCYYRARKYDDAATRYTAALEQTAALPEQTAARVELLEGLLGCLLKQRKLTEAEGYCRQLVEAAGKRALTGNPVYASSYLWSLLQSMEICQALGKTNEAETARADASTLLANLIDLRKQQVEAPGAIPAVRATMFRDYVKDMHPAGTTDYLWLAVNFEPKTLPLIAWSQGPSKAAIICIHGMGLENRAFTVFGQEMSRRGFAVYSLDVRGFGAWQAVEGHEDTAYDETLADIKRVANFIHRRNPDLPIFVLGESMGGAIALRSAAKYGDAFNGVIASVPSAERYQSEVMGFKVALGILAGGLEKPMDVSEQISSQATTRTDLIELWREDPKGKPKMAPIELIKFDLFMRNTVRRCKSITKTPVLVVQGLADRLVKPQGTFDMFKAIPNKDRTLVVIGDAEHLIFETDKQDEVLIESICAWLDKHIKPATAEHPPGSMPTAGEKAN